ncbi:hypothetical protein LBMAG38_20580 [Chloroflexota bacterium]|nr:hypothetical protein LBMAG38_20580 [Chloroflexota bacterium]
MVGSLAQQHHDTVGVSFSKILLRVCYHYTQFGQRRTDLSHYVWSQGCLWNIGIIKKFASAEICNEIFSRLITIYDW